MKQYFDLWNDEFDCLCGYHYTDAGFASIAAFDKCRKHHVVKVVECEGGHKTYYNLLDEEENKAYRSAEKKIKDFLDKQVSDLQAFLDTNNIHVIAEHGFPLKEDVGVRNWHLTATQWNKIKKYLESLNGRFISWSVYEKGIPVEKRKYTQMCCRFNLYKEIVENA